MKKIIIQILVLAAIIGCTKAVAEKPENLIPEAQMVDIFYDLSLLEAIKTQKPVALEQNNILPNEYIYSKYKVDSLQFVESHRYYASDLERYKKMYDEVSKRLDQNKKTVDEVLKKNGGIVQPEQQGVIR